MRCDSASNSPDPTVRRGQSVICLPLAYTQHGHSTALASLQQIRCRATDWSAVCSAHTVQRRPSSLRQLTSTTTSRVKTKTMRQVGTTQPASRLTSILTHTMSPSTPTHTLPLPTEPQHQSFLVGPVPCIMQDDRGPAVFAIFLACDRRVAQKPSWLAGLTT